MATVRVAELPADRKQDYAAFTRVVTADARQVLALEIAKPIASSAVGDLKADELNRSGFAALQAGNYAEAITLLKRVVELEPKDKTAWNNLGRSYTALGQYELAIEAFRKQIEINPYDQYVYANLGHAYVEQQKYAEAEAAFQKQIEVNPLDRVRNGQPRFTVSRASSRTESAVSQFQKAITMRPDDAWLQAQLGKAHLNLKQEAAAVAAFDRAVELSPTPTMWNDIAYEFALKGVHLDRALQYAESAVSSATCLHRRNLDIDARSDDKALDVVRSLGAYWDTLGWGVFRAWRRRSRGAAGGSGVAARSARGGCADHLAQIYQKLGRSEDAIRTYALALAAERPSDEIRQRLVEHRR